MAKLYKENEIVVCLAGRKTSPAGHRRSEGIKRQWTE